MIYTIKWIISFFTNTYWIILLSSIPDMKNLVESQVLFGQNELQSYRLSSRTAKSRQGRFLSLFTYVKFSNEQCVGSEGEEGICLANSECARRGGSSAGTCAGGYGICCIIAVSCGQTISENGTHFVNNGYPGAYDATGSCQVTLLKSSPDVCQFRLDFNRLDLFSPEPQNHICNNDQFIVSGGNPVPAICGNSSGNHMYIEAGAGIRNAITLSVVTGGPSYPRMWNIRVSQIPCNSEVKAEVGCLQSFTRVTGQILSFNYNAQTGRQLSNQDYAICIRTERNFCSIQFTQCSDNFSVNNISQSFTLSGNSNTRVQAMVGSTGPNSCQNDYLIIPMASNIGRPATGTTASVDRICGGVLGADVTVTPTTVRSAVRPFRLWFHTDSLEAPNDIDNKGFCLNYVQQPCTSG